MPPSIAVTSWGLSTLNAWQAALRTLGIPIDRYDSRSLASRDLPKTRLVHLYVPRCHTTPQKEHPFPGTPLDYTLSPLPTCCSIYNQETLSPPPAIRKAASSDAFAACPSMSQPPAPEFNPKLPSKMIGPRTIFPVCLPYQELAYNTNVPTPKVFI